MPLVPKRATFPLSPTLCACILAAAVGLALPTPGFSQATQTVTPSPATRGAPSGAVSSLDGLPVLAVEIRDTRGNIPPDAAEAMAQVRTQVGQPYSHAIADLDYRAIASLGRYISVVAQVEERANPHGVVVRFIVEERATVNAVEVTGNRQFSDSDVREHLIVRPGSMLDRSSIEEDRRYILDLYRKKGYAQASVDVDDKRLEQGVVHYEIIEGPQTQIMKIEIVGNSALSASYIKWRIQTKTYFWIFRKGTLDQEKLDADVGAIREMYRKKGYRDARVSYTLEFSEDKSKVVVRFVVLEGMQYHIGKMTVSGSTIFSNSELLGDTTRFGPGSVAELDKIDALQHRIEDAYGHEGYIQRVVEVIPEYTETPGIVDLNINIHEGVPYTVGRIIVRGNSTIKDNVIRRQVRIYPDQTFDMVLVKKSVERLKATRIFQDVKITDIPSPGNPAGVRDALVEVSEGLTGKYSFGAGISTNSGLVGQFSIEQQNFDITNWPHSLDEFVRGQSFKGAGQYFRLLLEPGTEFQRYRVTFQEPYLFDSPYSLANDLYYFTRNRESWDERRVGDIVTFGRRFGDVWGLSLALRAEQVSITHPQDILNDRITETRQPFPVGPGRIGYFNDTAQEILDEEGGHFLTSVKPAIVRDTTDSAVFPTTGTRTSFSIEQYGAVGGEVDMTKIVLGFNWYKTLYTDIFDRKTVFALRNEIGLIPFGNSPTYERFYLGGIGELRGFKFRGVSPRDGPLKDPIGGDFSWLTTAEVNYPIYEDFLRGVVFVDIGTVEKNITIDTIRSDVGAGVRVTLPFLQGLPVALDLAYPVTKQEGDRTEFISVSLGVPF